MNNHEQLIKLLTKLKRINDDPETIRINQEIKEENNLIAAGNLSCPVAVALRRAAFKQLEGGSDVRDTAGRYDNCERDHLRLASSSD